MALTGTLGGSMLLPSGRHASTGYVSTSSVAPVPVVRASTGQAVARQSASEYQMRATGTSSTPLKSRSQLIQQPPPRLGPTRSRTSSSLLSSTKATGSATPLASGSRPYTPVPSRPIASFTPLSPKRSPTPLKPAAMLAKAAIAPRVPGPTKATTTTSPAPSRAATTTSAITPATVAQSSLAATTVGTTPLFTPKSAVPLPASAGSLIAPATIASPVKTLPTMASLSVPVGATQVGLSLGQSRTTSLSAKLGSAVAAMTPTPTYIPASGGSFTVPAACNGSLTVPAACTVGSLAVPVASTVPAACTVGSLVVPVTPTVPAACTVGSLAVPVAPTVPAASNGSLTLPVASNAIMLSPCSVLPSTAAPAVSLDPPPASHQMLQAGTQVKIQGNLYCVTEPLGMGSFGAVWAAERVDGVAGEVAIKEIACASQKELSDAALEGKLLRMIHSSRPRELKDKAPDLVGTEIVPFGSDQYVMRLAMTKVPGIQLDSFLEMCRNPCNAVNNAALATATAVVAAQSQTLSGVCKFARDMLSQLAFIFECMSPVVYHRDVSPHNILIDIMNSSGFKFGLVDFGLGSDLQSWHGPQGAGSWHHADIGGDCRYWPISVWVMFVSGAEELTKAVALGKEYQTRLDFHAVGITVLEVVMTLLPPSALAKEEINALHVAWNQYWQDVTRFWKRTMEVFDSGQDPTPLKLWIRGGGRVNEILGADLAALRTALRRAGQACRASCPDGAHLFTTLLELVSNAGRAGVAEGLQNPNWRRIRTMIDADSSVGTVASISRAAGSATAPNFGGSMLVSVGQVGASCGGSLVVPSAIATPMKSIQAGSMLVPAKSPVLSPQSGSSMLPAGSGLLDVKRARSPVCIPSRSPLAMYASPARAVRI